MNLNNFSSAVLLALMLISKPGSTSTTVALELALLVDVSGSVDIDEYNLQNAGYVDAFRSAEIQNLIASTPNGIAVTFIHWAGEFKQSVEVDWTHLTDAASSASFANDIGKVLRLQTGNTAPGSAINFAAPLFASNSFDGARKVIDVSGDGIENEGADTVTARNAALAAGFTINGLPILGSEAGVDIWYQNHVVGGPNAFLIAADGFDAFGEAVTQKLYSEIANVPLPATLPLFTAALAFTAMLRRRIAGNWTSVGNT